MCEEEVISIRKQLDKIVIDKSNNAQVKICMIVQSISFTFSRYLSLAEMTSLNCEFL